MKISRMIDLLKIELKCMLRKSHNDCDSQCEICDLVQDDGELYEMYTDVIALLESIAPRVMTPEEAYDWLSTEKMFRDPVWFEVKDGIVVCVATDIIFKPEHWDSFKDWYGKTWRCWTGSKPSEEMRQETEWE